MSFLFQTLNAPSTSPCTGVAWGHYMMCDLPVGAVGTDSMGPCFAFIYFSRYKYSRMFLMAHVATDAEAQWLVDLNLNQNSPQERFTPHSFFALVTGKAPNDSTTMKRIGWLRDKYRIPPQHIVSNKNSDRGGVHIAGIGLKGQVVVTSCKSITASNNTTYVANTNIGIQQPVPYLRPMAQSDASFYRSTFEDGE